MKKEKVEIFSKNHFDCFESAQKLYDNENKKFKFKWILGIISIITPICWVIFYNDYHNEVLEKIVTVPIIIGWIAAIVSSPITIIKSVWKIGRWFWYIVPFFFFDIFGLIFGLALGLIVFAYIPTVYCAIGLYQSYLNKTEAAEYLALAQIENNTGNDNCYKT